MESPLTAERLMNSYCGFDRGGRVLSNPPLWWVFYLSGKPRSELSSLSRAVSATSAAHRNGRRWEKSSLPDQDALGRRVAHGYRYQTRIGSELIVRSVGGLAVVVLTTFGLLEASSTFVVATATIVWGVGLLLCGAAVLSQMNVLPAKYSATETDLASFSTGWSPSFSLISSVLCLGFWRGSASHRRSSSAPRRSRTAALWRSAVMPAYECRFWRRPTDADPALARIAHAFSVTPRTGLRGATILHRIAADIAGEICR